MIPTPRVREPAGLIAEILLPLFRYIVYDELGMLGGVHIYNRSETKSSCTRTYLCMSCPAQSVHPHGVDRRPAPHAGDNAAGAIW